jgi:hypothetical protein
MRTLAITLPISQKHAIWPVRVRIGVDSKSALDSFDKLYDADARGVVSAWSAPLDLSTGTGGAVKLVERRFGILGVGKQIRAWEETGESIARHLWYLESHFSLMTAFVKYVCLGMPG